MLMWVEHRPSLYALTTIQCGRFGCNAKKDLQAGTWKDIFRTQEEENACIKAVTAHKVLYTTVPHTLYDKISNWKGWLRESSLFHLDMNRHYPGL